MAFFPVKEEPKSLTSSFEEEEDEIAFHYCTHNTFPFPKRALLKLRTEIGQRPFLDPKEGQDDIIQMRIQIPCKCDWIPKSVKDQFANALLKAMRIDSELPIRKDLEDLLDMLTVPVTAQKNWKDENNMILFFRARSMNSFEKLHMTIKDGQLQKTLARILEIDTIRSAWYEELIFLHITIFIPSTDYHWESKVSSTLLSSISRSKLMTDVQVFKSEETKCAILPNMITIRDEKFRERKRSSVIWQFEDMSTPVSQWTKKMKKSELRPKTDKSATYSYSHLHGKHNYPPTANLSTARRYAQMDGDLYTISWNGFPRVYGFLQRLNSIYARWEGTRTRFFELMSEDPDHRFQIRKMKECMDTIKGNLKILVVGELRERIKVEALARNKEQLGDNFSVEHVNARTLLNFLQLEDSLLVVYTIRVIAKDDFSNCPKDSKYWLKYLSKWNEIDVFYALDIDPSIDQTSQQFKDFESKLVQIIKHIKSNGQFNDVDAKNCIISEFSSTNILSKKISDMLEERIISVLNLIKEDLTRNLRIKPVQSNARYLSREFFMLIKEAVNFLFVDDRFIANEIMLGFFDKDGSIEIDSLREILLNCLIRVIERKLVNLLSSSNDLVHNSVTSCLNQIRFERQCRENIAKIHVDKLIKFIPPAVIGFPCQYFRCPEGRKTFLDLFTKIAYENHAELLMENLASIIDDATYRIQMLEVRKNQAIQEKLDFEVATVLSRTIGKERFQHLLPLVEMPSVDLLAIHGVKGYGIMYNKLHVHIEKMDEEDEKKVREKINDMLVNYPHPHEIGMIVEGPKSFFYVGDKLSAACSTNGIKPSYGTVGAFMRDQNGDLYILTCKHVVALADRPSSLYLTNDTVVDQDPVGIGTAIYIPTNAKKVNQEIQNSNLIDIAAVKVRKDMIQCCSVNFKRPDGTTGPSHVFKGSLKDVYGLSIYKWGASTGKTEGMIGSANYRHKNLIQYPDCNLLIEALPGNGHSCIFAKEGDSGSTVCSLQEDDDASINVIAMISAGKMTILDDYGQENEIVFAFYLHKGIEILPVELYPCE